MNAKRVVAVVCGAGLATSVMGQTFKMTHNLMDDFVDTGTILCDEPGPPQSTRDNRFWRQFDLADFGLGDITVQEIEFGVQKFFAPSFGGMTEVTINLYEGAAGARPVTGLPLIATATQRYADQSRTVVSMPIEACATAGTSLVVEIVPQDFSGSTAGDSAWIGSNGYGETDPSYLSSFACGIPDPLTYPEIGCGACFQQISIIMNVYGVEGHECMPRCYADCDGSGGLDFFDFLCFQNAFAAGIAYADCDGSGSHDVQDFLCFQSEFAIGCR